MLSAFTFIGESPQSAACGVRRAACGEHRASWALKAGHVEQGGQTIEVVMASAFCGETNQTSAARRWNLPVSLRSLWGFILRFVANI